MDTNFTFDGQRADEEVILFRRQHPWVLAGLGFLITFLILAVVIVFIVNGNNSISFLVLGIAAIIGIMFSFNRSYLYKNVLFILTNQRILSVDQSSIFGRKVQETELINIYNITYNMKGVIKNILNFGDIILTTEGDATDRIMLKNVSVPQEVFEKISKARKEALDHINTGQHLIIR